MKVLKPSTYFFYLFLCRHIMLLEMDTDKSLSFLLQISRYPHIVCCKLIQNQMMIPIQILMIHLNVTNTEFVLLIFHFYYIHILNLSIFSFWVLVLPLYADMCWRGFVVFVPLGFSDKSVLVSLRKVLSFLNLLYLW